jgi:hypothetical protein
MKRAIPGWGVPGHVSDNRVDRCRWIRTLDLLPETTRIDSRGEFPGSGGRNIYLGRAIGPSGVGLPTTGPHSGEIIDVGENKQLFLDDAYLVETSIRVRPVLRQPVKHGFPVLLPDRPWEEGGLHQGSVMFDEGIFKMWYGALHGAKQRTRCFCYATSRDGIDWQKPALGLFEWEGSKDNNIVMVPREDEEGLGTACVFKDPEEEDREKAYKLVHHYLKKEGDDYLYGLQAATSPDGVAWTRIPEPLFTSKTPLDAFNIVFWDEFLERYVAYVRRWLRRCLPLEKRRQFPAEPKGLRCVGRCESEDFVNWSSPDAIVLSPDERDPPQSDYYGPGAFKYASHAYFMMTPFFDHATDRVHIRLATSRDDLSWRLAADRQAFIPNGDPQAWDSGQIYPLVPPVVNDDTIHIYYHGLDAGHWGALASDGYRANGGFGLATLPLDGFISLEAAHLMGVVTTWPMKFSGRALYLNMEADPIDESYWGPDHGIAVEVLDEDGYAVPEFSRHDCDRLTESGFRQGVSWNGRDDLALLAGKPVKLRFYMRFARLYSFQFSD